MTHLLARTRGGVVGTYPALGYPTFRLYWGGTIVSLVGMWMQALAQGWLVLDLTDSPKMLGLVGAVWAVPNLALSLVGGVVADRLDRRRLLIVTRSVGVVTSLVISALVFAGQIQVWHVFAAAVVMGTATAFDMPSSQALVPALVQPRHLMNAIALLSAAFSGTRIVGPSIAGVLVAQFGVGVCYLLAGLSTLAMIGALAVISVPRIGGSKRGSLWSETREGLAYVRRDDLRMALLGMMLVNSLFGMAYPAMMPVFARDVLAAGPEGYGALMATSGLGSLIGTLLVATFGHLTRMGRAAIAGSVSFGVALVGFALSQSLHLSLVLMTAVGLANAIYGTLVSTLLQSRLEEEFRGRAMSVVSLVMNTMPLAGLQAGFLADSFGASLSLVFNGAVVTVTSVAAGAFIPRLRKA